MTQLKLTLQTLNPYMPLNKTTSFHTDIGSPLPLMEGLYHSFKFYMPDIILKTCYTVSIIINLQFMLRDTQTCVSQIIITRNVAHKKHFSGKRVAIF